MYIYILIFVYIQYILIFVLVNSGWRSDCIQKLRPALPLLFFISYTLSCVNNFPSGRRNSTKVSRINAMKSISILIWTIFILGLYLTATIHYATLYSNNWREPIMCLVMWMDMFDWFPQTARKVAKDFVAVRNLFSLYRKILNYTWLTPIVPSFWESICCTERILMISRSTNNKVLGAF